MKTKFIFLSALLFAFTFALTSCNKGGDDDYTEEQEQEQSKGMTGKSLKNKTKSNGYVTYTVSFTSASACTVKYSGKNTSGKSISDSATCTYTVSSSGVINIKGCWPDWTGSTATLSKGSGWEFDLHPVGGQYQDNVGDYWS